MARKFNGTSDYLTGVPGALSGMDGGPITIASILILDGTSPGGAIVYCGGGDVSGVSLDVFEGSYFLASQEPALASASTSDGWHLVAGTKAAGTQTPRFHKYVYSTDAWTHADAGGTMGDGTTVAGGDTLQIGRWGTGSGRFNGSIAVIGVWDRVLADAEIELLAFSLQAWYASAPKAAWLLDQDTATTSIVDLTGGGANVTGGTGTSVAASSLPAFTYGFDVDLPHSVPAAAGTNADAGSAAGTGTANSSTIAVAPTAGSVGATGTANAPSAAVSPASGSASATASAFNATVQTATTAQAAAGTGTANGPTAAVGPTSGAAAATVTANGPAAAVGPTANSAAASAVAHDATVTTGSAANAAAVLAAAAAVVNNAGAALLVSAGVATGAATAWQATTSGPDFSATTWRAGRPESKWTASRPESKWSAGRPEGG